MIIKNLGEAVRSLYPNCFIEWCENDDTDLLKLDVEFDVDDLVAESLRLEKQGKLDNAHNLLQQLCDQKTRDAKKYVAGFEITQEQLERYEEKYKMALAYKKDKSYAKEFQLEATLNNITVDALTDMIVTKGVEHEQALRAFNAVIEAFRTKVKNLIDEDINKAIVIIEKAKNLGANTTAEDIKKLFK